MKGLTTQNFYMSIMHTKRKFFDIKNFTIKALIQFKQLFHISA